MEGERDADNVAALGLAATCNVLGAGAGKWRDDYIRRLQTAGVTSAIILPDNDPPGRAHADAVAASCHAAGIEVRILAPAGLPVKGDASDWITDGGTRDQLTALAAAAPVWTPAAPPPSHPVRTVTVTAASTITIQPVRYLWAGRMALSSGYSRAGKASASRAVSYTVAAQVTRGTLPGAYLGTPTRRHHRCGVRTSWSHTRWCRSLMAAGAEFYGPRVPPSTWSRRTGGADSLSPCQMDVADAGGHTIRAHTRPQLVILDPLLSRLPC